MREKVIASAVGSLPGQTGHALRGRCQSSGRRRLRRITFQMLDPGRCSPKAIGARILILNMMAPARASVAKIDGCCRAAGEWLVLSNHRWLTDLGPRLDRGEVGMEIWRFL